jgi:hypothetical protein
MAEWNESQQRGETVHPDNPPRAVVKPELRKSPAVAVVGMWYYLAPLAIIIIIVVMALMFWNSREDVNDSAVPTTGIEQEAPAHQDTPGGINPEPRHETTEGEQEYRGGDQR